MYLHKEDYFKDIVMDVSNRKDANAIYKVDKLVW
jgi:hypothetical protein